MGFDVYLRWDGITNEEESAQITGYSTVHGHVGYLRWSYDEPNPVLALLKPFMNDDDYPDRITKVKGVDLTDRLPKVKEAIDHWDDIKPNIKNEIFESFNNFCHLFELKEDAGLNPIIEVR